ncbi:cytochrome D1 domain-containing protein [Pseudomonas sp. P2757]|uniref:YncE family protein n=1 Tax=unclassified Pseudomonas TaxID=196821 RepID=UPI003B5C2547
MPTINVNSTQVTNALVLRPMFIVGASTQVLPANTVHYGVSQAIYSPTTPLTIVIDPAATLSISRAAYDSVVIYVNGVRTPVIKIIQLGEENMRFALDLPWGLFKNGINTMFYRWERLSGGYADSTPVLKVLFNNPAPTAKVAHPATVGPGQTVVITITINDARPHDTGTLNIGPWSHTFTNPDPTKPISYTLTTADLKTIGDGVRSVFAVVSDQLTNTEVSATTSITISTAAAVLVTFINGPYSASAGGQVTGIELSLTQSGQPIVGTIKVTLPTGTTFPNGKRVGNFVTGPDGKVRLAGVTASGVAGTSSIKAVSGGSTASAVLTITAQAPLGPIAVSPTPTGITYSSDGKLAYVTGAKLVQVIDTTRSTLIKQIPLPSLDVSWEIALSKNASRAFACNGNNALSVIDTNTNSLIANIPAAGHPIGIVLSNDGSQAFVSTWQTNTVVVIDAVNLKSVKTIHVGPYPRGIDISQDGRWVYVANFGNGPGWSVSVIDALTLSVVRTVPMPVAAYGVAVSPDGKSIYVCGVDNSGIGYVVKFDALTFTQIAAIQVIGWPRGIVLNHAGTRAYCCDNGTNTVTTIDTALDQVIATTTVGQGPVQIGISPDDSRALVTCVYDNTVWAISLLPGASSQGSSSAGVSGVTSTISQSRAPLPGDAY